MKKIINGRTYNTETAKKVGNWTGPVEGWEGLYFEETLYLKRTGEFFLHLVGNDLSPYRDGWSEDIAPLRFTQARAWAKEKLDRKALGDYFIELKDGEDDKSEEALYVPGVPSALMGRVRSKAQKDGATIKQTIITALERAFRVEDIDTRELLGTLNDFMHDRYDIYNSESAAAGKDYHGIFSAALDTINDQLGTAYTIPYVSDWICDIDADINDDHIPGNFDVVNYYYFDRWLAQSGLIETTIKEALNAYESRKN